MSDVYIGNFAANSTVYAFFTTNDAAGGRVEPNSAFEAADLYIYKNDSATERASASGITMTSPFDSKVGVQQVAIDLSDNTDPGFWAAGNDYFVLLYPDETVDGQNISKVIAHFSIENRIGVTAAQVNAQADTALSDIGLDHLVSSAVTGTDITDNSIIARMVSKSVTADWDSFNNTTDSLEALSDNSAPSAATIADAVWDEAGADHVSAGSTGLFLSDINTAVAGTIAELSVSIPAANPTIKQAVMLNYMGTRNKLTHTSSQRKIYNDAGTAIIQNTVADDGTTFTQSKMEAGT